MDGEFKIVNLRKLSELQGNTECGIDCRLVLIVKNVKEVTVYVVHD